MTLPISRYALVTDLQARAVVHAPAAAGTRAHAIRPIRPEPAAATTVPATRGTLGQAGS